MNKKAIGIVLIIGIALLIASWVNGALVIVPPFKRSGTNIIPRTSTDHLGGTSNRIAKIWATDMDVAGAFDMGGTVGTGGIDMSGSALTKASYIQTGYITATSSAGAATSSFEHAVAIATSSAISTYELTVWGDMAVGTNMTPPFTISNAGAVVALTLDTGFGANELYDMDQHVLTSSNVTFGNVTSTNTTSSGYLYGATITDGTFSVSSGAITATTFGGIASANLLDKSATESISGEWTFVTTTVTGGDFVVDTSTLVVDNDNNRVGIGTTTPDTIFQVAGADNATTTITCGSGASPCCFKKRDTDEAGWTYCRWLDGTETCNGTSCE